MLLERKGDYLVGGIGINILQQNFKNLPKAASIFSLTQLKFNLKNFAESFHYYVFEKLMKNEIPKNILELYNQNLYKKDQVSVFEKNRIRQNGIIKCADENGNLCVDLENEGLQKFFHKEIEMLY